MARKASKNYFTKETEDYIVKYNNCTDPVERDRIFTQHIYFPFYKLAENIIHTFKFYKIDVDTIEDLKLDIITMLVQDKISKFDPTYGAKAYSYFGTIVKRWLIAYCNANYKRSKQHTGIAAYIDYLQEDYEPEITPSLPLAGILDNWIVEVSENLEEMFPKEEDREIAEAVLTVFKSRQDLQIFKKKALYIYVREITGCETPYLTKTIAKLKESFYERLRVLQKEGLVSEDVFGK